MPEKLLERFSPDTWTLDWSLLQRLQLLDAGHFALETHVEEIAAAMLEFLPGTAMR